MDTTDLPVKSEIPIVKDRRKKLDDNHRMIILRMKAESHTIPVILDYLKEQFNITVNKQTITEICNSVKNQSYLKQFRENYLARVKDVPIANKRFRLDDMEKVRVKLNTFLDAIDTSDKQGRTEYREVTGCLIRIIEVAREEMERKPQLVNNTLVNFQEISDDQLIERKRHLIKRLERLNGGGTTRTDPDSRIAESEDSGEPS